MSKKSKLNSKTIAELGTRVTQLESTIAKLVIAMESVAKSPGPSVKAPATAKAPAKPKKTIVKAPAAPPPVARQAAPAKKATAPTKPKATAPTKTANGNTAPTLAEALTYVLKHHQAAKSGPVKAGQLYDDVMQAGYKFIGTSRENNLNYLNKLLRTNNTFKKAAEGGYTLV